MSRLPKNDAVTEVRVRAVRGRAITAWSPRLADGRVPLEPSIVLAHPPRFEEGSAEGGGGCSFAVRDGIVCARVARSAGDSCYGTGEVTGPLLRDGRTVRMWNTDAWSHDEEDDALYQSHPFVLAVRRDGSAVGWLADTCRRGEVEIGVDGVKFRFEGEPFTLFVIEGATPGRVLEGLASLVGRIALPPLWALGYQQCRWSYATADEVRAVARELDERGIPCDALWLDIDHQDRHRVFTWDGTRFPDPRGLIDELHARGLHAVAIVDPGVAIDEEYALYREGAAGDHFVRSRNGRPARGRVWPGPCRFPDFTAARTRRWWAGHAARFVREAGLDGLWADMNEPALLPGPRRTLPDSARHAGLAPAGPGNHARYHNLYGQLMAQATHAGLRTARPDRRPFVLTRANHVAGARFAATWTGDNRARWEDLRATIPMVLNLGLSGQPFAGADVGGFVGDPSPELFARWFALAAFLPFFRGHSEQGACRKEPWSFGAEVEAWVRAAIRRRMRWMPTLYTLFREAAETGLPVVRPLFFAAPRDPELRGIDDCFLLGGDLLVAPVVHEGAMERTVRLPANPGGWFPLDGGARIEAREITVSAPLGTLPAFARAGSILFATEPGRRAAIGGHLFLHAFLDDAGNAEGSLYEDDGEGHVRADGVFLERRIRVREEGGTYATVVESRGTWRPPPRPRLLYVFGASAAHASGPVALGPELP